MESSEWKTCLSYYFLNFKVASDLNAAILKAQRAETSEPKQVFS